MAEILVTGGTGFLGQHLISQLGQKGHHVRVLTRSESNTAALKKQPHVTLQRGDLMDANSLLPIVEGVRVVFHCAGGGKVQRPSDFREQNLVTTQSLVQALLKAKQPAHLIFASSLAAHGPAAGRETRHPAAAGRPVSLYGKAKKEAEDLLRQHLSELHVTIFRPPAIYGPGDTRWLAFFKCIQRNFVPMPPGKSMSIIYGPDCAEAMIRAMETRPKNGSAYFVDDGQIHTWPDLIKTAAAIMQKKPRSVPLPKSLLWSLGALNEARAAITSRPVVLTRDKWRDAAQAHWLCDSALTRADLDWKAKTQLPAGFENTIRWYKEHDWL